MALRLQISNTGVVNFEASAERTDSVFQLTAIACTKLQIVEVEITVGMSRMQHIPNPRDRNMDEVLQSHFSMIVGRLVTFKDCWQIDSHIFLCLLENEQRYEVTKLIGVGRPTLQIVYVVNQISPQKDTRSLVNLVHNVAYYMSRQKASLS